MLISVYTKKYFISNLPVCRQTGKKTGPASKDKAQESPSPADAVALANQLTIYFRFQRAFAAPGWKNRH